MPRKRIPLEALVPLTRDELERRRNVLERTAHHLKQQVLQGGPAGEPVDPLMVNWLEAIRHALEEVYARKEAAPWELPTSLDRGLEGGVPAWEGTEPEPEDGPEIDEPDPGERTLH